MKNLAKDLLIMMLTGITFPASVYAAQLDTQQQIIAQKEQGKLPNALNRICSIALVSL